MVDNYVIDDGMSPFMDGTFTYHIRRAGKPGVVGTLRADHATHDLLQAVFVALEAAQAKRDGYKAQVERVEALHQPTRRGPGAEGYPWCCSHCDDALWPCATRVALDSRPRNEISDRREPR
jgi:hypothetical protein